MREMDADVAVVGLGSMGSMALWQLASIGVRALGLEQFQPGHDKGAGHGDSRIFRSAYAEGSEYVPLLKAALPLWRALEEETGRPLLIMSGGLMIGDPSAEFLQGVMRSAREHQLRHQMLAADEATQRFPQLRLQPGEQVVWEPRAGVLRPELAVAAAIDRARQLGARVMENARVQSVVQRNSHVELVCGGGTYRVERAIVASGAWILSLFTRNDLPFWVERQVQVWFPVDDPELYAPERFGVFVRHMDGRDWYGFPTLDRRTIKVAIHHGGDPSDPDRLDRTVSPSDVQPLAELVAWQLRGVQATAVRSEVCMYTNTPDDRFVIGPLPDADRIILAGPMGGHGFKFAPVVGRIVAQLATKGRTDHPIEPFLPSRLTELNGIGPAELPPAG